MKIKNYLFLSVFIAQLSFGIQLNVPSQNSDRCTNIHLEHEAPYFNLPRIKKFRHPENVLLSSFFTPNHSIDDLILNQSNSIQIHARFNYDNVLHKDLEDEYVHAYIYQDGSLNWSYLGKYKTDAQGEIFITLKDQLDISDSIIRMVAEGDLSTVDGFLSIINPEHEAIVFDIDGTLTLSDFELVKDYFELVTATPYYYAAQMLNAYDQKGYELIFLTARPYWLTAISRYWLNSLSSEGWPLKTKTSLISSEETAQYKAAYLKNLIQEKKINIIRAYGNALTDIEAYALAGIPKKNTFIIGPNAGENGTNPVYNDYYKHYFNVVLSTPEAKCKRNIR